MGNPLLFPLSTVLCFYCVDQEGLHTSLKPEEPLVYFTTAVVGMSELGRTGYSKSLCMLLMVLLTAA